MFKCSMEINTALFRRRSQLIWNLANRPAFVFLSLQGGTKCVYVSSYYGYPFEGIVRVRSASTEEELG